MATINDRMPMSVEASGDSKHSGYAALHSETPPHIAPAKTANMATNNAFTAKNAATDFSTPRV